MQIQNRFLDAVNTVLDWDIPEEGYTQAVNAQACHLAGPEAEDGWNCEAWGGDVWRYDIHDVGRYNIRHGVH